MLGDLVDELEEQGIRLVFARARHELRADLGRFGTLDGRVAFVDSVGGAVNGFLAEEREPQGS